MSDSGLSISRNFSAKLTSKGLNNVYHRGHPPFGQLKVVLIPASDVHWSTVRPSSARTKCPTWYVVAQLLQSAPLCYHKGRVRVGCETHRDRTAPALARRVVAYFSRLLPVLSKSPAVVSSHVSGGQRVTIQNLNRRQVSVSFSARSSACELRYI